MSIKKEVKKALKAAGGSMKLKALAAAITTDITEVEAFIKENSKKYTVDGKVVSLAKGAGSDDEAPAPDKKRKAEEVAEPVLEPEPATSPVAAAAADEKKSKKEKKEKKAKKSKKESSSEPSSSSLDASTTTPTPTAPPGDIAAWRTSNKIVINHPNGSAVTHDILPWFTFADCPIRKEVKALFAEKKFQKPSPIQAQCWPIMCAGTDIVGIAETGSGKTLAFSVPALEKLSKHKVVTKKPKMLVLAPTRELALQSHDTLSEFGAPLNLRSLCIFGGVPKHEQKSSLKRGVEIIVATPGRLKDLIEEGACDLSDVEFLVLDEADRMLDLGFEQDVRFIISQCKVLGKRQTAMFSATWPASIQDLASEFMVNPIRVYVGFEAIIGSNGENSVDDSLSANKRVSQTIEVIEDRDRDHRITNLLGKYHKNRDNRVLVFALYKKECQRLESMLNRQGWVCCSIHGDKSQDQRMKALQDFKDNTCPLLIATDVAARGLDIPDVECVINFTFPLTIEDYVHRIGRTGRAGKSGISHTFFQPGDKSHAGELQQVMRQAGQAIPEELAAFGSTIKKKEHKLYGAFGPKGGPMKAATKITF